MATLKMQDIKKMSEQERKKKLKALKLELIKTKTGSSKQGSSKSKEIRKMIARIMTFNTFQKKEVLNKK